MIYIYRSDLFDMSTSFYVRITMDGTCAVVLYCISHFLLQYVRIAHFVALLLFCNRAQTGHGYPSR